MKYYPLLLLALVATSAAAEPVAPDPSPSPSIVVAAIPSPSPTTKFESLESASAYPLAFTSEHHTNCFDRSGADSGANAETGSAENTG